MNDLGDILRKSQVRVSWEEKQTDMGIQLQGSSASVKKTGIVFDTQFMPTGPSEMKLFFVIKKDNGDIGLVPADHCRIEP
ncbi:MAG: hypothetical protein QXL01_00050 [Thermoplasmatales archaeon]